MLDYKIADDSIVFQWDDDEALREFRTGTVKFPGWVEREHIVRIAEAVRTVSLGGAEKSYPSYFNAARMIFGHISEHKLKFPPSDSGWDNFVLTHYTEHLSRTDILFKTRMQSWCLISVLYRKLQRDGFIPHDVYIPSESLSSLKTSDHVGEPLGHKRIKVEAANSVEYLLPKKYLVESGLSLEDDVYLLDLKHTLERRATTLLECCKDYWDRMLRCHARGADVYNTVSIDEIEKVLRTNEFTHNGLHLAHPDSPFGIHWFLAVARYYAEKTDQPEKITIKDLGKLPFFRKMIHNATIKPKILKSIWELTGEDGISNRTANENLNRLLGYLSPRDCAVASAIIGAENPNFNPSSLTNIRIYKQNGKFYLRVYSDTRRIVFSVSKPRARERKVSLLPPLSARIVADVIRCTSMARVRLINKRKSGWRKLFLVSSRTQIGSSTKFTCTLASYNGLSFYEMYKTRLGSAGITPDMLNLFRIRCTQGILEFLRTGNMQSVADLLGNSLQVVRKNYIPEWLVNRWGTRFLRIIHQKAILTATEGSPWQLAASDFNTTEDLQEFIQKVLLGLKKGDVLSEAIRKRLGHYSPDASSIIEMFVESELLFDRSAISLSAIYAYADAVARMPADQTNAIDTGTQLPLWVFPALKDLVVKTVELDFDTATNAEIAVAERIAGESLREMKKSHYQALLLANDLRPLVSIK